MKSFVPVSFDCLLYKKEVQDLQQLLTTRPSLKERKDVLPFFKARPHLSALCGLYNTDMTLPNLVAWEFDLFGDFSCDLAVGDSTKKLYTFVEFEDAGPKSLFVKQGKKATREWSDRFDHGYSQIIDWFYKLNDRRNSDEYEARFGKRSVNFAGVLVVGRDSFLEAGEKNRLEWRREHVVVHSKKIVCVTFDELVKDLTARIDMFQEARKRARRRKK